MTSSDYREAYAETGRIADLFKNALLEYVLVFIGYGFREPAIKQLLSTAFRHKRGVAEQFKKFDILLDTTQEHFALMREGESSSTEILELFQNCQVRVIEFTATNKDYSELTKMIDDLYRRTVSVKTPEIRHYLSAASIDERRDL